MHKVFTAITCGISIIQNIMENKTEIRNELLKKFQVKSIKELLKNKQFDLYLEKEALIKGEFFQKIYRILIEDPEKYSAELNTFTKLMKYLKNTYKVENVKIGLFSTDTGIAYFCTRLIEQYLQNSLIENVKIDVDITSRISGFGKGIKYFQEALNNLADVYVRTLMKWYKKGYDIYTIITGGLKIEVAYLTVLSFLVKSKIVYTPKQAEKLIKEESPIALKFLEKHLGVSTKKMVFIGDNYNDIDAMRIAGLSVAMGNSPDEVKKVADMIVPSCDEEGVSYLVREMMRGGLK